MASVTANTVHSSRPRGSSIDKAFWLQAIVSSLIFAVVFINASDFRGDTGEKFAIHWQIYLRLLVCGACGGVAILLMHRSLAPFFTMPGLMITALIIWIGATCVTSINKNYSIAAFVSLGAVVMLIPATMQILGARGFLLAIGAGFLAFMIGSWGVYLLIPEIGVFKEQVSNTEVYERMGGLGHPNELGFFAASTVVLFCALHYCRRLGIALAGPAALLGFATLVTCFSRTSLILMTFGLLMVYRKELFTERVLLWAMLGLLVLLPSVAYVYATGELDWIISESLDKVSKSGSSDELTTGTGRTEIWAYALQKIAEQPLYGYGYGTQRFIMVDHSYHCHNIFLNYSMSTGLLGGLIYLSMAFYLLHAMWIDPRPEIDGLLIMILLGGLAEGLLVSPTPTAPTVIFTAAVFWRQLRMSIGEDPLPA